MVLLQAVKLLTEAIRAKNTPPNFVTPEVRRRSVFS
jgi:hypothetical protein